MADTDDLHDAGETNDPPASMSEMRVAEPGETVEFGSKKAVSKETAGGYRMEHHKISCPYCAVGYAILSARVYPGAQQIDGIKDAHKCATCGRAFFLKTQVQIVGVRIEDMKGYAG